MRISRRTSGGRGEYEISEGFQELQPVDLFERRLLIDFGDSWIIDTGTTLRHQGGKRRIRILDAEIHLPRQVAAALLMPRPVRADEALGRGRPVLKSDRYAIEHLHLADVRLVDEDTAELEIGEVDLRNADLHAETLRLPDRVSELRRVWDNADRLPDEIRDLLALHRSHVETGGPIPLKAEQIVGRLENTLTETGADFGIFRQGGEDVLPDLKQTLDLAEEPPEPPIRVEEVDPEEIEIKRRTVREWKRWSASRGAQSAKFRNKVREAYRWTCVICGARFPRTSFNRIAGVDGAHILPWSDYDLDDAGNGLCLCRTHHWAFDEGLLTVRWNEGAELYYVEVPPEAEEVILREDPEFSLDELRALEGPIPEGRLPANAAHHPRPQFLEMLYDLYHRL